MCNLNLEFGESLEEESENLLYNFQTDEISSPYSFSEHYVVNHTFFRDNVQTLWYWRVYNLLWAPNTLTQIPKDSPSWKFKYNHLIINFMKWNPKATFQNYTNNFEKYAKFTNLNFDIDEQDNFENETENSDRELRAEIFEAYPLLKKREPWKRRQSAIVDYKDYLNNLELPEGVNVDEIEQAYRNEKLEQQKFTFAMEKYPEHFSKIYPFGNFNKEPNETQYNEPSTTENIVYEEGSYDPFNEFNDDNLFSTDDDNTKLIENPHFDIAQETSERVSRLRSERLDIEKALKAYHNEEFRSKNFPVPLTTLPIKINISDYISEEALIYKTGLTLGWNPDGDAIFEIPVERLRNGPSRYSADAGDYDEEGRLIVIFDEPRARYKTRKRLIEEQERLEQGLTNEPQEKRPRGRPTKEAMLARMSIPQRDHYFRTHPPKEKRPRGRPSFLDSVKGLDPRSYIILNPRKEKRPRGRPRIHPIKEIDTTKEKRPRGRPRKVQSTEFGSHNG